MERYLIYVKWTSGMEKTFETDSKPVFKKMRGTFSDNDQMLLFNNYPLINLERAEKLVIYDRKYIIEKDQV